MTWGINTTTLTVSQARESLYKLLDRTAHSPGPIRITGKRTSAVLIFEEDWRAIQETLHLLSIPRMRDSIRKGLKAPIKKTSGNCIGELVACSQKTGSKGRKKNQLLRVCVPH